jgi:hypothetical protein
MTIQSDIIAYSQITISLLKELDAPDMNAVTVKVNAQNVVANAIHIAYLAGRLKEQNDNMHN